jgi:hypothetical protein
MFLFKILFAQRFPVWKRRTRSLILSFDDLVFMLVEKEDAADCEWQRFPVD